jgi:glyoxylase-like metal-dependent hydrolase (beta-lactamase superfamily II)
MNEFYASKRFAHSPLAIDMTKSPTMLTRRSIFRAGAALAVAATATPLLIPALARAEDARQAVAEPLNGHGFYRFEIGDFQATVISDGYGPIPVSILAVNAAEAELAPLLKANFMQPVIQITTNMLVVDTGRERILIDTGFGEKLGPTFGSFPGLEANLSRAGITPESIDLVVTSHGHLDHIAGLVTKSGVLAFPKAQVVFVDTEWNYWTGNRTQDCHRRLDCARRYRLRGVAVEKVRLDRASGGGWRVEVAIINELVEFGTIPGNAQTF